MTGQASGDRPLSAFGGAIPDRPAWFVSALANAAERSMVTADGVELELLCWGERGRPGLLFLPGMGAAASWYEAIAPYFAADYRCAALSWSGMGRSGWRDSYSSEHPVHEIDAAIEAGGLAPGGQLPLVVAHSFGTLGAAIWAQQRPGAPALILIDNTRIDPDCNWRPPPPRTRPARLFASPAEALMNFRLTPPQPCENLFLVDYIAREGMFETCDAEGRRAWRWRYDTTMMSRMDYRDVEPFRNLSSRTAFIWGDRSISISNGGPAYVARRFPDAPSVVIPECGHHVMLDQPLPLVATLRALLSQWAA